MNKNIRIFIWRKNKFSQRFLNENKSTIEKWLTPEELLRAQNIENKSKKIEFIHGRFLLRVICARYYKIKNFKIKYKKMGKPYIRGGPFFNLSHSGENIMLAIGERGEIGADIEMADSKKAPRRPYAKILQRYSHNHEFKSFLSLNKAAQKNEFYKIWTMKESYAKATGHGLTNNVKDYLNSNGCYCLGRKKNLIWAICCLPINRKSGQKKSALPTPLVYEVKWMKNDFKFKKQ